MPSDVQLEVGWKGESLIWYEYVGRVEALEACVGEDELG